MQVLAIQQSIANARGLIYALKSKSASRLSDAPSVAAHAEPSSSAVHINYVCGDDDSDFRPDPAFLGVCSTPHAAGKPWCNGSTEPIDLEIGQGDTKMPQVENWAVPAGRGQRGQTEHSRRGLARPRTGRGAHSCRRESFGISHLPGRTRGASVSHRCNRSRRFSCKVLSHVQQIAGAQLLVCSAAKSAESWWVKENLQHAHTARKRRDICTRSEILVKLTKGAEARIVRVPSGKVCPCASQRRFLFFSLVPLGDLGRCVAQKVAI